MVEDIIRMDNLVRAKEYAFFRNVVSLTATRHTEYAFPNDERELERLDMQHTMQTMLLGGKLFWSPIGPSPHKILDLGTGTGNPIRLDDRGIYHTDRSVKESGRLRWRIYTLPQKYRIISLLFRN
jgi:hypothetical protein